MHAKDFLLLRQITMYPSSIVSTVYVNNLLMSFVEKKKQTSSHCMCTLYYIQATITRNIQSSSVAIFMQREKGDEDMGVPYGFLFYSALRPFSDSQIIGTGMLYRPHLMTHLMVIR